MKPLIKKEECCDSRCPENKDHPPRLYQNGKMVLLDLNAKGIESLLEHCCIANEYCYTEAGKKVVIIHNITIKSTLRGKKILSKMLERQKRVYRKKNFFKIILTATNNGLVVWHRVGFKYLQKRDELKILKSLNEYLKEVRGITKRYKSIKEVEPELLYDESETENFTDWLIRHNINNIKMIMEL